MNTYKVIKYHWMSSRINLAIFAAVMAIDAILVALTSYYTQGRGSSPLKITGNLDMMAIVWVFIIGLVFFKPGFKFLLANGVTRKKFFLAGIPSLGVMAASWAVITLAMTYMLRLFSDYSLLNESLYNDRSVFSTILWLFSAFFMLLVLGWFISLVYYRSGKLMKVVVSVIPILLLSLLFYADNRAGGTVYNGIGRFLAAVMGFSAGTPNPYIASATMIVLAFVLSGFIFLLIRKAEVKD